MTTISAPILSNIRLLGMMKLLYIYGGMFCPISFVCLKDLKEMYYKGIQGEKMFVCETINRNITSTTLDFYPSIFFCGSPKGCETIREFCNFISQEYIYDDAFLGEYNKWFKQGIENFKINLIEGKYIGTSTTENKQIVIDDLMSNDFIDFYDKMYGIYIPAEDILKRRKFEWFSRLSPKQVLQSNTIIGNYILLSQTKGENTLEPLEPTINKAIENNFVGFWKIPSLSPYYGLKPNFLGDNLQKIKYSGR